MTNSCVLKIFVCVTLLSKKSSRVPGHRGKRIYRWVTISHDGTSSKVSRRAVIFCLCSLYVARHVAFKTYSPFSVWYVTWSVYETRKRDFENGFMFFAKSTLASSRQTVCFCSSSKVMIRLISRFVKDEKGCENRKDREFRSTTTEKSNVPYSSDCLSRH